MSNQITFLVELRRGDVVKVVVATFAHEIGHAVHRVAVVNVLELVEAAPLPTPLQIDRHILAVAQRLVSRTVVLNGLQAVEIVGQERFHCLYSISLFAFTKIVFFFVTFTFDLYLKINKIALKLN